MRKHKRPNRIRKATRKNLPFGLFQYEVTFTASKDEILSKIISVPMSIKKTKYYKKPKYNRSYGVTLASSINLDELIDHAEDMFIGKYKIDIRERKYPLKLYLTNEEDITALFFFHFDKYIKHIRKIETNDGIGFDTLYVEEISHKNHHWMVGDQHFQNYSEATKMGSELGLPILHIIKET